jgi:UPF0716 protein FxsA
MSAALLVAFLVVPIVEIYVIIQVGQAIGALPTVVLLVLESALGAWIVRREGARAWRSLRGAIGSGRLPSRELADAALVLVGGVLLLTPGFVTDVFGFFFVLPPTRPLARRLLFALIARRAEQRLGVRRPASGPRRPPRVVPGEVVGEGHDPQSSRDPGSRDKRPRDLRGPHTDEPPRT